MQANMRGGCVTWTLGSVGAVAAAAAAGGGADEHLQQQTAA